MSRRGRSLAFLGAALVAAVAAAAIAESYGSSVARGYGRLRPVVVAGARLEAGEAIDPALAEASLEVRRAPVRFLPPGALRSPAEAIGLVPAAAVPPGSYLLASQLRPPRPHRPGTVLDPGRRPVQIAVSGASALLGAPAGTQVDVVVTTEPSGAADGRAYVAATAVPLLALGSTAEGSEAGLEGTVEATLALTRSQALRLIAAQSFARQITILPAG